MCKYTNNYGREIVVKENDYLNVFFLIHTKTLRLTFYKKSTEKKQTLNFRL